MGLANKIKACSWVFGSFLVLILGAFTESTAQILGSYGLNFLQMGAVVNDCGEKVTPIETYEQIAYFSLAGGLGLVFLSTFLKSKKNQIVLVILALIPLGIWGYVKLNIDYDQIKRIIFTYNVQAEGALSNIAEGQERFKSEHGNFVNDLTKLRAHIAGANGMGECVQVLEIKAHYDYWTASAKQVSSPDVIFWDSRKGSSLKKG
jgi:hypothetical protein